MVFCRSSESLSDSVALESPGKHRLPYWGTVQRVGHMLGDSMPGDTLCPLGQCVTAQGAERVGHLNSHSVQCAPLQLSHPRGTPQCNHPYGLILPHQEVTSHHPAQKGELTAGVRPLPVPTAVSLSPGCSCLMAPMAVALIFSECVPITSHL